MIVRIGSKADSEETRLFCDELLKIAGTKKKQTPQRTIIKMNGSDLASIGKTHEGSSVEFRTGKEDYAEAHGSKYVKPHTNNLLAKEGWLIGLPNSQDEFQQIITWIKKSVTD